LTALLYGVFVALAVLGLRDWRAALRRNLPPEPAAQLAGKAA